MATPTPGLLGNSRQPWKKSASLPGKTMERGLQPRGAQETQLSAPATLPIKAPRKRAARGPSCRSLPGIQPGSAKPCSVKLLLTSNFEPVSGLF